MKKGTALGLAVEELERATGEHGSFASAHEGYAVLKEEVDELWDEVKAGNASTHRGVSEAVQVAAMALRFLIDVCEEPAAKAHTAKVKAHDAKKRRFVPDSSSRLGGYSG